MPIQRKIDIEVTPQEAGKMFANWNSEQQSDFMQAAGMEFSGWAAFIHVELQAHYFADDAEKLNQKTRAVAMAVHFFETFIESFKIREAG